MKLLHATLFASQLFAASSLALPRVVQSRGGAGAAGGIVVVGNGGGNGNGGNNGVGRGNGVNNGVGRGNGANNGVGRGNGANNGVGRGQAGNGVGRGNVGGEAGGEGVGAGEGAAGCQEIEQEAQFGVPIELGGGDIKTDTLFPPSDIGLFEVEFQNPDARVLTVTENATPGNAPLGFDFLEPVSYVVELQGGAEGLTLQKVDYILNAGSTLDISQGQIGKLCTETNTYVVGAGVGELEFEVEENELTLTVDDLNGDWAIFVPAAAGGAAGGAAGDAAGNAPGNGTEVAATTASAGAGTGVATGGAAQYTG